MAGSFKVTTGEAYAQVGDLEINQLSENFQNETKRITKRTMDIMRNPKIKGLGKYVENLCKQERDARLAYIKDPKNTNTKESYKSFNKVVKKETKILQKKISEQNTRLMEYDFHQNNSCNLFKTVKELERIPQNTMHIVIDKYGNKHTNINKVLKCWKDHLQEHLSKCFSHQQSAVDKIYENNNPNQPIETMTKEEIRRIIGAMKNCKVPGTDTPLSPEVLQAGVDEMIKFLPMLLTRSGENFIHWNAQK